MLHLIRKIAALSLATITLGNFSLAHAGAYMYCVNANDPNKWGWAQWEVKGKETPPDWLVTDKDGAEYQGDVWLYGSLESEHDIGYTNLLISVTGSGPLAFPGNTNRYRNTAKGYCDALVKICTDQYGHDYRYIGAGAGVVAGWNGLSMYQGDNLYTCPNWRVDHEELDASNRYHVTCMDPERASIFSQNPAGSDTWTDGTKSYQTSQHFLYRDDLAMLHHQVGKLYCAGQ